MTLPLATWVDDNPVAGTFNTSLYQSRLSGGIWSAPVKIYDTHDTPPPAWPSLDPNMEGVSVMSGGILVRIVGNFGSGSKDYVCFLKPDGAGGYNPVPIPNTGTAFLQSFSADHDLYGPLLAANGALYCWGFSNKGAGVFKFSVQKSIDGGATWVEQDEANAPVGLGSNGYAPNNTTLVIPRDDLATLAFQNFDFTTDTYGAAYGLVGGPLTTGADDATAVYTRQLSNGDLVVVWNTASVFFAKYTLASNTWTTGKTTIATKAGGQNLGAVTLTTDDGVYAFYAQTSPNEGNGFCRKVKADATLAAEVAITRTTGSGGIPFGYGSVVNGVMYTPDKDFTGTAFIPQADIATPDTGAPPVFTQQTIAAEGTAGDDEDFINITEGAPASEITLACPVTNTGSVGVPFSAQLIVSGDTPPDVFSIIAGALPPGLSLNAATGVISGTPTTAGTFNYTAQVVDSLDGTATVSCSILISAFLTLCFKGEKVYPQS